MASLDIAGAAGKVRKMATDSGAAKLVGWLIGLLSISIGVIGLLVGHITTIQEMAESHAAIKKEVHENYVPRETLAVQLVSVNTSLLRLSNEVESLRRELKAGGGGK